MVFKLNARKQQDDTWSVSLWTPSGILSRLGFKDDAEWSAFRSLLMPSAKADFTLTEVDENGKTL